MPSAVQFDPAAFTARQDEIAAEMVALTGCSEFNARLAAGSYLTFKNAPNYGLGGIEDQRAAGAASIAIKAWLQAQEAAEIAKRVAA